MATFQRARTEAQRSERRQLILETAAAMLDEMPVVALTLNELSRRVGLAKSNVLRYFESREAVLLELLDARAQSLLGDLALTFASEIEPAARPRERARHVATTVTTALSARPVLCELLAAQSGVLEHNVSVEVAGRYKHAALSRLDDLATLFRLALPELDDDRAAEAALLTVALAGELWTYSRPASAVTAAINADARLAPARVPFTETLERSVFVLLLGLLSERLEAR